MSSRFPVLRACLSAMLCAAGFFAATLAAEEKTENYPDGGKHLVYTVNDAGRKEGGYREFHPNGKLKVQAAYHLDKLTGVYKEFDAKGKPLVLATYREGKLHGARQESAEGKLVRDELWLNGHLLVPQSAALLAARLRAIQSLRLQTVGEIPAATPAAIRPLVENRQLQAQREAGLRTLMAYRCACGLPYADIALDRTYIAHDEAASALLTQVGQLAHTPPNPGWPENDYQFAFQGTSHSNLSSIASPVEAVKSFMDDSNAGNIERLGHRRWCLNPALAKTGFGCGGRYGPMWSFDASRKDVPDYSFVAFPPRGLAPVAGFKPQMAWSVSLNPDKYQAPAPDNVKVKVVPARFQPRQLTVEKSPEELPLNYFHVNLEPYGIPNCIIFRPAGVKIAPGAAYWVEVRGLKTAAGDDTLVQYLVAFVAL